MIQEIRIKNFLSFKDEMTFSFEATRDKFAEDYQVVKMPDGTRLLRFAMVYGANASGKSNLLCIFDFLRSFWLHATENLTETTHSIPFMFDTESPNSPSHLELFFYVEGLRYWYQLDLDTENVISEKLSYYKSTQPTMLFQREMKDGKSVISYGVPFKLNNAEKDKIAVECLKNMSFFAARNRSNVSLPEIDKAIRWMKEQFAPLISPTSAITKKAEQDVYQDADLKTYLIRFFQNPAFNITNIFTEKAENHIPNSYIEALNISDAAKRQLIEDNKKYDTKFEHIVTNERGVERYLLPLRLESYGTQRIFGLATAIYHAQKGNQFMPIDEIESSLHPKFLETLIFEYLKNQSQSQIIVTIHDDSLMDLVNNLVRKDSIWFTEKKESGTTDLFRLTDFKGLSRITSIRSAYRLGRFGATMKKQTHEEAI